MTQAYLNNPLDISKDFRETDHEYFIPGNVKRFDATSGKGRVQWLYHRYQFDWFFNKIDKHLQQLENKGAPFQDYDLHPEYEFSLEFTGPRTIRLRMKTNTAARKNEPSLMLVQEPGHFNAAAEVQEHAVKYSSEYGTVTLQKHPFKLELHDADGKKLTSTQSIDELQAMHSKAMPFSFIKRSTDYSRSIAASFSLSPGEKIVGCGESFTAPNKRGQKIVLWTSDAQSTASQQMYKPVPFFISSRGYGMFVHSSAPMSFDFGHTHDGSTCLYNGDDELDLFIFLGSPLEVLAAYTELTGRSPLPPLWSFGLWMSRFSYKSQEEVKEVASNLRKYSVPCDVIHIDAGWFKKGINCDFEFCRDQFPQPEKMMKELKAEGFRTSLWQIPYFTPLNPIFNEVVDEQLYVRDGKGGVATEDAILDLTNERTVKWYSSRIKNLLNQGASVIKADFGEAAPYKGIYASGKSGFYEHNLYPLRYNQLISFFTKSVTGEHIIWARSAWAGSQRYPLHWGGDAEVSDAGMSGTLRGGLSLGLSGFSFWSHDIGGFSGSPNEELFLRWAFFGLFSSHSRVHGFPPREPWEFGEAFQKTFREIVECRYRLMPYIFTQAAIASKEGMPMLKALLLEWPGDPVAWMIDDQYLLGKNLMVAPLMEAGQTARSIYLPEGKWVDYFTGKTYEGKQYHQVSTGTLPGVLMVKWGTLLPVIKLEQSTSKMNFEETEFIAYGDEKASGELYFKDRLLTLQGRYKNQWQLADAEFTIRGYNE